VTFLGVRGFGLRFCFLDGLGFGFGVWDEGFQVSGFGRSRLTAADLVVYARPVLSHGMCQLNGCRNSSPLPNRQLLVDHY
jgi:hypothetical protein